jgi:hypothetical protein
MPRPFKALRTYVRDSETYGCYLYLRKKVNQIQGGPVWALQGCH